MLSMSACSFFEGLRAPSLSTALSPGPLPAQPQPPLPPPAPPPQSLEPPAPNAARDDIAAWLAAHGYKDFQIEALLEHARIESGFQACAAGPGGYRYIFQWGGGRLQQLQEFAHTSGCPHIHTQLAFADHELRDEPNFSCFWAATNEAGAFRALRRGFGNGSC
jgi:hypothetical protein